MSQDQDVPALRRTIEAKPQPCYTYNKTDSTRALGPSN